MSEDVTPPALPERKGMDPGNRRVVLVVVGILGAIVAWIVLYNTVIAEPGDGYHNWLCKREIQNSMTIATVPDIDVQESYAPDPGPGMAAWVMRGTVTAENAFGAHIVQDFTCQISAGDEPGGDTAHVYFADHYED